MNFRPVHIALVMDHPARHFARALQFMAAEAPSVVSVLP